MKFTIKNQELAQELVGEIKNFPKYTTQLMNLANQNAQGTRPRVVGQLSELINECPEKTYEGWKKWYLAKYPNAIGNATEKMNEMMDNIKKAAGLIDKAMIEQWVEDLVLEKTFVGLRFQEAILKRVAAMNNEHWHFANPEEESQGIDGFIGNTPVSIKPTTYKTKNALPEEIKIPIIFYTKTKSGLQIESTQLEK